MKRGAPLKRTEFASKTFGADITVDWRGTPKGQRVRLARVARLLGAVPLKRRKGLPRVSKDRAKRARVRLRQYGDRAYMDWLHAQPCQLAGVRMQALPGSAGTRCRVYTPDRMSIEAAHIRPKGAGHGAEVNGAPNLLSLCPGHHDWQGRRTPERVQREAGVDLWAIAARQRAEYEAQR